MAFSFLAVEISLFIDTISLFNSLASLSNCAFCCIKLFKSSDAPPPLNLFDCPPRDIFVSTLVSSLSNVSLSVSKKNI